MASRFESTDDAGGVANKVIASLVQPFDLEGREIFVNASIGITIYPFDETDPDALLRFADSAMYRAKDDGRNTYRYYTSDMNQRAR